MKKKLTLLTLMKNVTQEKDVFFNKRKFVLHNISVFVIYNVIFYKKA